MEELRIRYFGYQPLHLPTPIPVSPTFHRMSYEEVMEADDDYFQMVHFHYLLTSEAERRKGLRLLVEEAVTTEDEAAVSEREKSGPNTTVKERRHLSADCDLRKRSSSSDRRLSKRRRERSYLKRRPGKIEDCCSTSTESQSSGYLYSDSARLKFFDFESVGRPWNDYLVWVEGSCLQVPDEPMLELNHRYYNPKPKLLATPDKTSLFDCVAGDQGELTEEKAEVSVSALGEVEKSSLKRKWYLGEDSHRTKPLVAAKMKELEQKYCHMTGTNSQHLEDEYLEYTFAFSTLMKGARQYLDKRSQEFDALMAKERRVADATAAVEKCSDLSKHDKLMTDAVAEALVKRDHFINSYYVFGLSVDDVELTRNGIYAKIEFPAEDEEEEVVGDAAGLPAKASDFLQIERLRKTNSELEKSLSRARDPVTCIQQVLNKTEYERRQFKLNSEKTFKKLYDMQCRYARIKVERDEVLRKEEKNGRLIQKPKELSCFNDPSDKARCQSMLLALTMYFDVKVDSERGLKEAYIELLRERCIVPDPARVMFFAQEFCNRHSLEDRRAVRIVFFREHIYPSRAKVAARIEHERHIDSVFKFYGGELSRVENEFRKFVTGCGKWKMLRQKTYGLPEMKDRLLVNNPFLGHGRSRQKRRRILSFGREVGVTGRETYFVRRDGGSGTLDYRGEMDNPVTNTYHEMVAIYRGLCIALERRIKKFIINTNSTAMMDYINKGVKPPWRCKVSPKAYGHTRGRKVISRDEAVMRIKAVIDARKESGSDIVIIARTDSRQAISLEESLWRSRAFADAGADVLFIDALSSKEEMKALCEIAPLLPKW
ncbi:hypothetical protein GIB67_017511 [Kingdonia uniflora]|uniref:Uncharacterized protein n=1 Tax=Kingdonia uniflora TaxID=39325 RepID=A0A7J7M4S7_9MAGN|nr:hypothetical protein GIB67_017511 [Kingdonia uniflora]